MKLYTIEFRHKEKHSTWFTYPSEYELEEALSLIRMKRLQYIDYEWRMADNLGPLLEEPGNVQS